MNWDQFFAYDFMALAKRERHWKAIAKTYPQDARPPVPSECWTKKQRKAENERAARFYDAKHACVKRIADREGLAEYGPGSAFVALLDRLPSGLSENEKIAWFEGYCLT